MTTTSNAAAEFSRRRLSPAQRIQHLLHAHPWLSPLLILVLTTIVFSALNGRYLAPNAQSLLLQQVAVVACLAIGQTLIILTAGIDLSVGSITILSMMTMASLAANSKVNGGLAILIGIAVAVGAGFLNGILVTKVNLPPFIVTLGTLSIFTTMVDHDAPLTFEGDLTDSMQLAALGRELAANDWAENPSMRRGSPLDRNTELLLPAPFDLGVITDSALEAQRMVEKARILAHESRNAG